MWRSPVDSETFLGIGVDRHSGLTNDIIPIPCHSHNDYSRDVPLLQAIYAGCISVEADVWLPTEAFRTRFPEVSDEDLLVGHSRSSLQPDRTLRSLYTDPLWKMLHFANDRDDGLGIHYDNGIFDHHPGQPLTLLIDIKEAPDDTYNRIQLHLDSFRGRQPNETGLTYWDIEAGKRIDRPLTIVLTGDAPFDSILDDKKNYFRDVFYDAPLHDLYPKGTDNASPYNQSNSYYASTSMKQHVGYPGVTNGRFSEEQSAKMKSQIADADNLGLVARYWATPDWPAGRRSYVWQTLLNLSVGILNVDEIEVAARWDWTNSLLGYCWLLRGVGFKNVCE